MKKSIIRVIALSLIAVMMCFALVSCGGPNSDPDKAKEALEKNGYAAEKLDGIGLLAFAWAGKGVETVVTGVNKEEATKAVVVIYYEDKDAAATAWEGVEKYFTENKDKEKESDYEIKQSGNMIWFGHKDAVKAAK